MNEERDFWGDNEEKETREVIGYCIHCKDPIYENDKYVTFENQLYHKECFILLFGDGEEEIANE